MKYYIYKIYDKDNILLYIGRTINLKERIEKHYSEQPWCNEIEYIDYEECSSKTNMIVNEIIYINNLNPKYNIASKYGSPYTLQNEKVKRYYKEDFDIIKKDKRKIVRKRKKDKTQNEIHEMYLEFFNKNKNNLADISYNKHGFLQASFKNITQEESSEIWDSSMPIYLDSITEPYDNQCGFVFRNMEDLKYSKCEEHISKLNDIYKVLEIDKLCLDKDSRIEKMISYLNNLIKDNKAIVLEHLILNKTIEISIHELIKNLKKVVNSGEKYYSLDYGNFDLRYIFYNDICDDEELYYWISQLNGVIYKFKTEKDYILFLFAICKYKIPWAIEHGNKGLSMNFIDFIDEDLTVEKLQKYN